MSLDKPLDLEFIGKGSYGVIFKKKTEHNYYYIIKQFRVENYEDGSTSYEREVEFAKNANNINNDIFIRIINNYKSDINLAKQVGICVPLINCISINIYGYIHMEYMNEGDLYNFIKKNDYSDIIGILGCYFNGLYILHNKLKIVHGDLTPNNLLIHYVGGNYKQKIIINNKSYDLDTKGYCYKISDFGLAEKLENTKTPKCYINHIYRDYLLLFFIQFNKNRFYNYDIFSNLIDITIERINDDLYDGYHNINEFNKCFEEEYNYNSVCNFMSKHLEIDFDSTLIYDTPKILLYEFIEILSEIIMYI